MRLQGAGIAAVAMTCALAAPAGAKAAVSFSSTPYPLPAADSEFHSRVGAVSITDLDADGRPDVVVYRGGGNAGRLFVLLNQGAGRLGPAQEYPVCANPDGGTMVTGPFDAGPTVDVILGCEAGTGHDRLLGAGDGTLGPATHFPGIALNNVLALWPSNTGGRPDLLYSQSAGQQYLCYRPVDDLASPVCPPDTSASDENGPSGHASIGPALATARFYASPCTHDDVIVSPYLAGIRAWGPNPAGTASVPACSSFAYSERQVSLPAGAVLSGIATGDLTGDKVPDVLMTGGEQFNPDTLVALVWQSGATDPAGGFPPGQQPVLTPSIRGIQDVHLADLDGDGILDAAVEGSDGAAESGTLAVSRGRGDGGFETPPATFPVPGGAENTNRFAVADLDADGRPDVVSVALDTPSVTVLLNSTPAPGGDSPPPPPPPGGVADTTAPALTALKLSAARFAVGRGRTALSATVRRGTTLRYTLSEAASVTVAIARAASGRRSGRACVSPTRRLRRAKRCTRYAGKGTLVRTGAAGANAVAFSGRLGRRALAPGSYRMTVLATDAAGNRSKPHRLSFVVVRG